MKTLLLAGAWCGLGLCVARADLTLVQTVEGAGESVENTVRLKEGKIRLETSPGTSLIIDLKSGEMINLLHGPKTYLKVSGPVAQTVIESLKQGQGAATAADAKSTLTATGKKGAISGFAAEEYTCVPGGAKLTLWLTRALPNYEAALKELSGALGQGPMGPLVQSYGIDLANLPGFPVRTILEIAPGQTMTRTVTSLSAKPISAEEFELPPGYKEVVMPVLTPPAAAPALASPAP